MGEMKKKRGEGDGDTMLGATKRASVMGTGLWGIFYGRDEKKRGEGDGDTMLGATKRASVMGTGLWGIFYGSVFCGIFLFNFYMKMLKWFL